MKKRWRPRCVELESRDTPSSFHLAPDHIWDVMSGIAKPAPAHHHRSLAVSPAVNSVRFVENMTPTNPSGASAICYGPDNMLYVGEEGANKVAQLNPTTGVWQEWNIPSPNAGMGGEAAVSPTEVVFSEFKTNRLGNLDPTTGVITETAIPVAASGPGGIVVGSDGNLWVLLATVGEVAKVDPSTLSVLGTYRMSSSGCTPHGPSVSPVDGAVYWAEISGNRIGRVATDGTVKEWLLPWAGQKPTCTAVAPDGSIYFTMQSGWIGRLDPTTGIFQRWKAPTVSGVPYGIVIGTDGNVYVTERTANKLAIMALGGGTIQEFLIPLSNSAPNHMVLDGNGHPWFSQQQASAVAEVITT